MFEKYETFFYVLFYNVKQSDAGWEKNLFSFPFGSDN
jgi:hypothetical protein